MPPAASRRARPLSPITSRDSRTLPRGARSAPKWCRPKSRATIQIEPSSSAASPVHTSPGAPVREATLTCPPVVRLTRTRRAGWKRTQTDSGVSAMPTAISPSGRPSCEKATAVAPAWQISEVRGRPLPGSAAAEPPAPCVAGETEQAASANSRAPPARRAMRVGMEIPPASGQASITYECSSERLYFGGAHQKRPLPLEPVALHLDRQAVPRQPQQAGGLRLVAVGAAHGLADRRLLAGADQLLQVEVGGGVDA